MGQGGSGVRDRDRDEVIAVEGTETKLKGRGLQANRSNRIRVISREDMAGQERTRSAAQHSTQG
jgi:hypothetical protein